jgi:uncharacterized membrane protein
MDYQPWNVSNWVSNGFGGAWITQMVLAIIAMCGVSVIVGWIIYAFASGRTDHQRLSEATAIPHTIHLPTGLAASAASTNR